MKTHALYPLTFHPIYHDDPWGGQRIAQCFNRANTPSPCSESWEVSGVDGAESIVAHGSFEGIGLGTLAQTFGPELTGTKAPNPEVFPLLIKLLDIHRLLPPQVLPGGAQELLYILDALPEATFQAGIAPDAPAKGAEKHLLVHPSRPGDLFTVPTGLVHTFSAGNLVYEVQQTHRPSPLTFPSPEAERAIVREAKATCLPASNKSNRSLQPRLNTAEFSFATLNLQRERTIGTTEQSFMIFFCVSGKTTLEHHGPRPLTLLPGDTALLPPNQVAMLHPLMPSQLLLTTL